MIRTYGSHLEALAEGRTEKKPRDERGAGEISSLPSLNLFNVVPRRPHSGMLATMMAGIDVVLL